MARKAKEKWRGGFVSSGLHCIKRGTSQDSEKKRKEKDEEKKDEENVKAPLDSCSKNAVTRPATSGTVFAPRAR